MNAERNARLEILAYKIWEEQGRPEGRQEENWAEAERRLRFESDGLSMSENSSSTGVADALNESREEMPARSQQEQPARAASPGIDSKSSSSRRARPR